MKNVLALLIIAASLIRSSSAAFVTTTTTTTMSPSPYGKTSTPSSSSSSSSSSSTTTHISANKKPDSSDATFVSKASWYAVEAFGNLFGNKNKLAAQSLEPTTIIIDTTRAPRSLSETLQRIQADNARQYFLSGTIDELIYDQDCVFADPFVSFTGRDRFVKNLANLGSFITEYSAKPIEYNNNNNNNNNDDASSETAAGVMVTTTKFMVKLRLNLPWQPVLAWPWGVRCEIDPTSHLIVLHQESWDIEPWEGVQQIFRKPTTRI